MTERKRMVSEEQLKKMSPEQLQQVEDKLGETIRNLIDSTVESANKLLGIYGLQVKMQFLIEEKCDK